MQERHNSIANALELISLALTHQYVCNHLCWFSFGLEQEGGSLIAPMALAHPLHPIDSRSRNRHQNLWVGWCVSSWWPLFPSRSSVLIYIYIYIHLYIYSLYTNSVIGRIYTYNRSAVQYWWSCTPSQSIGLGFFWGGVHGSWVECLFFVFFGLPIVSCSMINSLILGCLWPLVFVLNNILTLGIWHSAISHLPGCFCPWTFFQNIRFNMVLSDPFMSHLATQLGYSAGEFQALQLIVLAAFGVVD